MARYDYERRELLRLLDTDAQCFAAKVECRDGSERIGTRWLAFTRAEIEALLDFYERGEGDES